MPFPTVGVVDDFERTDGDPGSNWTAAYVAASKPDINGGNLKSPSGARGAYWNKYAPDECEVWIEVPVMPSSGNEIHLTACTMNDARDGPPAASTSDWTGYQAFIQSDGTIGARRVDASSATPLYTSASGVASAGSLIGLRCHSASILELWHKPPAGAWDEQIMGDSTYLEGFMGVHFDDAVAEIAAFGGAGFRRFEVAASGDDNGGRRTTTSGWANIGSGPYADRGSAVANAVPQKSLAAGTYYLGNAYYRFDTLLPDNAQIIGAGFVAYIEAKNVTGDGLLISGDFYDFGGGASDASDWVAVSPADAIDVIDVAGLVVSDFNMIHLTGFSGISFDGVTGLRIAPTNSDAPTGDNFVRLGTFDAAGEAPYINIVFELTETPPSDTGTILFPRWVW